MRLRTQIHALLMLLVMTGLSACAFLPHQELSQQSVKTLQDLEPKLLEQSDAIEDQWWLSYGDPQLNQLVNMGLSSSPSLDISGARIMAAQAMLETERSAFIPQIGVGGQVDRQQLSQNYIFVPGMPIYTGYGLVNASLNWSLDIWGKQKKYFDAAKNQVKAAQANYKASELLLSTTIVRIYFDYDRLIRAQELFTRDVQVKNSLYQIAIARERAGLVDASYVNQQKIALNAVQVNLSQAKLSVKMAQHQLAALVQQGPSWGESLQPPVINVSRLMLPEVIPSNLIERRPDLQALLSQIDVAKLQLEGAKLEYLPDINLAGFVGVQSFGLSQLFASKSQQFSIGPGISLPIFDGGMINANISGKEANRNQAIANYQEQLVQALREVADGIGTVSNSQANYDSLSSSYTTAKNNFDISLNRNKVGISSKDKVLAAEEAFITQGQNFADAKAKLLTANVILVQALGGSYLKSDRANEVNKAK
jgi:NodT family efflux transporter outer membrane factor (OMF) lipoprotein